MKREQRTGNNTIDGSECFENMIECKKERSVCIPFDHFVENFRKPPNHTFVSLSNRKSFRNRHERINESIEPTFSIKILSKKEYQYKT